ncbi:hypothetical protein HanIR_Chr10g0485651 [Helianthus annuus]|nr:hypothetical protein HanIR_Chr10g0485651 [Helianthus annuus]
MTDLSGLSFVYAFPFFVQSPTDLPNSRDPSFRFNNNHNHHRFPWLQDLRESYINTELPTPISQHLSPIRLCETHIPIHCPHDLFVTLNLHNSTRTDPLFSHPSTFIGELRASPDLCFSFVRYTDFLQLKFFFVIFMK